MTVVTSIFHPYSTDGTGGADAESERTSADANVSSATSAAVGFKDKADGDTACMTKFDLDNPFSGPPMASNGRLVVLKAKITFKIHTTAVINGSFGFVGLGIMFNPINQVWMEPGVAFGSGGYPTKDQLPWAVNGDNTIKADRLWNDALISTAFGPRWGYTPTTYAAGNTIIVGEGYPSFQSLPIYDVHGDFLTNLVSELQEFLTRADFLNPSGSVGHWLGFSLEPFNTPTGADERFLLHTSDGAEDGVVLEIEWDDLTTVIRAGQRSRLRVQASETAGRQRVDPDYNAGNRVFAASQVGDRVDVTKTEARPRVLAPLSHARSQETS